MVTVAPVCWPVSSAHSLTAAVIWRMLLIQAFCCDVARAFTKLGMAIAASKPIMATTIMISTRVKPALRDCFILFMFQLSLISGVNTVTGGFIIMTFAFTGLPVTTAEPVLQKATPGHREVSITDAILQIACLGQEVELCMKICSFGRAP